MNILQPCSMREHGGYQETVELPTLIQATIGIEKPEPVAGQAEAYSADASAPNASTANAQHSFNEQTNYVTKRKIITVGNLRLHIAKNDVDRWATDFPSMFHCRPCGSYRPDNIGGEFTEYRFCAQCRKPERLDSSSLFLVRAAST